MSFTVKATGTQPLSYQWQWKPVVEGVHSGEWQNLSSGGSVQGAETATLTYRSIESCSEGLYRCVVTNDVGEEISEYTDHIISEFWMVSCGTFNGSLTILTATLRQCAFIYSCCFTLHVGKIRELHDVLNELSTVNQWHLFGIYLGLPLATLDAIKKDCVDIKECRTQMLIQWQRRVIPTWSAVVKALVGIGRERLASHLAAKYSTLHLCIDI